MFHPKHLRLLAQIAFFGALFFAFYEAVIPPYKMMPLFPWDKAEHFTAFYVLAWLAAAGFPRRSLVVIAVALGGIGMLIEIVQAIPAVNRDSDYKDWIADCLGILASLTPMLLFRWRKFLRESI